MGATPVLKLPWPELTDLADGPDAFGDLGRAVEDYLYNRILPPGVTRKPTLDWGSFPGALPAAADGVQPGDTCWSEVLQCQLMWVIYPSVGGRWRQATDALVDSGGVQGYIAALNAANMDMPHNSFRVYDTAADRLYVAATARTLVLAGGKPGAAVQNAGSFIAAANWSTSSIYLRTMGNGWAYANVTVQRTTSDLGVPGNGDHANTPLGNVPVGWEPADLSPLVSAASGRVAHGWISAGSTLVSLGATSPGTNIIVGDTIGLAGYYRLADANLV